MSTPWRKGKRVAIVGCGPGGLSAAIALRSRGMDVQIYERLPSSKGTGGAVMLSTPVLAILRSYGISMDNFPVSSPVSFHNNKGLNRVTLTHNKKVEDLMGIKGWYYGILRSVAYELMLEKLPSEIVHTNHKFVSFEESAVEVHVHFQDQPSVTADLLIGADGIKSKVSEQALGDLGLFHTNTRVWLSNCEYFEGIPPATGILHHNWQQQASFFPMYNKGRKGFEWWVMEPSYEGNTQPANPLEYVKSILEDFPDFMRLFPEHTNPKDVYCWEVYNRPLLDKWSKGRVVCIGDAVHPASPYAAYGMGMAIEDGYYLARALEGVDLQDQDAITRGFTSFESVRVTYVNKNVEFARSVGNIFHRVYWPFAKIRDLIFDRTPFLATQLTKGYQQTAHAECMSIKELHKK